MDVIEFQGTPKLSWRLWAAAKATGLSVPFLRKQIRLGKLPAKKRDGVLYVLDEDLRAYLAGGEAIEAYIQSDDLEARASLARHQ